MLLHDYADVIRPAECFVRRRPADCRYQIPIPTADLCIAPADHSVLAENLWRPQPCDSRPMTRF